MHDSLDLLPLRQMVNARDEAASAFARQGLLDGLSKPHRYQIISHGQGGQILAISEYALTEAQTLLKQTYGSLVTFGNVSVHTYVDPAAETQMVPVMFLRIDAPRAHARELQRIIEERSATTHEVEMQRDRVVIRAEALLSTALGLERQIGELTSRSAHVLCWLLRYQPAAAPGVAAAA